jgi:hypothetical protein
MEQRWYKQMERTVLDRYREYQQIKNDNDTIRPAMETNRSSFLIKRQGVVWGSWLLLARVLVNPSDIALLEARVDANGHVVWDLWGVGQSSSTAERMPIHTPVERSLTS